MSIIGLKLIIGNYSAGQPVKTLIINNNKMRTGKDEYKKEDGTIISIDQMTQPPKNAVLQNGFNYKTQQWTVNGIGYATATEACEAHDQIIKTACQNIENNYIKSGWLKA